MIPYCIRPGFENEGYRQAFTTGTFPYWPRSSLSSIFALRSSLFAAQFGKFISKLGHVSLFRVYGPFGNASRVFLWPPSFSNKRRRWQQSSSRSFKISCALKQSRSKKHRDLPASKSSKSVPSSASRQVAVFRNLPNRCSKTSEWRDVRN